jgi:hypothetical protein
MIKLSELHEQRKSFVPSSDDDYFVFDVEVDEELFAPPPNVREIGILATTTKGMVDDVVMDVLIAYHLAGLDTILEFPHEVDFFDARHLVQTAAQSNASLSFVPPSDLTDESFEAYCLKLEAVAKAYMGQQAMTRFVMPVTNYLQHMFLEVIDPEKAKSFVPEDSYVLARFHNVMPLERSDALKARVRAVIVEAAGGEEGFREFALGVIAAIAGSVETSLVETRDRLRPAAGSHWLMNRETGAFVAALFDREALEWTLVGPEGVTSLSDAEAAPDYRFIETIKPPRVFKGYRVLTRPGSYHLLSTDDDRIVPAYLQEGGIWIIAEGFGASTDDRLLADGYAPVGPVNEPSRGVAPRLRRGRRNKSKAASRPK